MHSRVAHAADHQQRPRPPHLEVERGRCESNSFLFWSPPDLRPLCYYCDVSGSNWFDLFQFSWPELVRSTSTSHNIKVLNSFLIEILRTGSYPILETSVELNPAPAFPLGGGQRKVSTCCQQSFFGISLHGSILPSPLF